jgi:succinoglycan biosynthesis transport protein ExoP
MEPATEQELADLTRGYDQSKANYDDLLKKKEQSEMATRHGGDAAGRAVHHA